MAMMAPVIGIGTVVPVAVTIVRRRLVRRLRLRITRRLCVGLRCCPSLRWTCHGQCSRQEQKT
jgi:hypothetical protein